MSQQLKMKIKLHTLNPDNYYEDSNNLTLEIEYKEK